MKTQLIISLSFMVFSFFVLVFALFFPSKKDSLARSYIRMCTGFYISGTLLIVLISVLKPNLPVTWTWLSEIFVFGIYAASCGMVYFVAKKFAEGQKPPTNVAANSDAAEIDSANSESADRDPSNIE